MYFLNINKPKGITSFDVIRKLRKRLNIKKIGHSGTLDPLASGVLQVAVEDATRLLEYLGSNKTYIADIKFGYITNTFDSEGEKQFVKTPDFSQSVLKDCILSFVGKSLQIPPKYSAIKQNGKKMCDMARNNKDNIIELQPREIEIYSIDLINFVDDYAQIKVCCKKGTYIRSLVNDIGIKIGCGAYMSDLKRICAGNFKIENSNELDDIEFNKIDPLEALELDKKELSDIEFKFVKNGNSIPQNQQFSTDKILLTKNNKLVSIANLSDNLIKPKKIFWRD